MTHNDLYTLLIRYVDGECSADEAVLIEERIKNDAYWAAEYEVLKAVNNSIPVTDCKTQQCWEAFCDSIQPSKNKVVKAFTYQTFIKYAAAAVILMVAGWYFLQQNTKPFNDFEKGISYQNTGSQSKSITLTDGSVVILNKQSTITIDSRFNRGQRLVTLTGNAFFNVAPNAAQPFIIKTNNTYTTVVGTSFEIDGTNNHVEVNLFSGKLNFTASNLSESLVAGDQIEYNNNKVVKRHSKTLNRDNWTYNNLSFKDATLNDIVNQLQAQYNIGISTTTIDRNQRYTVSFNNLNPETGLQLLSEITETKITKKGSTYFLNP